MPRWWSAIVLFAVVSTAFCDELDPGSWILEIYRPDAPIDVIHVAVAKDGDTFVFTNVDGDTIFEDVRIVDGELEFEHPVFEEMCRLSRKDEAAGWQGTCPPDNELQFETGLTISLRPPKAGEADADAEMEVSAPDDPG